MNSFFRFWFVSPPGPPPIALIRLPVGLIFFTQGILKFTDPHMGLLRFARIGFPHPNFTAHFVGTFEIACGLAVLAGLWTRAAALPLLIGIPASLQSEFSLTSPGTKITGQVIKKLSLVYEEGLYRGEGRTRLSAALVGGSGPDLIVGRATTRASHQSALSKRLSPPAKWSYLKVGSWSVLAFLCVGWLVFYVNTVTTNATTVSSVPLTLFALISAAFFALPLFVVWKHNHSTYQKRFAEWDRSFICSRCGTVSQQEFVQERNN